jgi:hypothetical protein
MDDDLFLMAADGLIAEIKRLRSAIRQHRDEKGHGRCWLDDQTLYRSLPETAQADFTLPPKEEFLTNCEIYWRTRQP